MDKTCLKMHCRTDSHEQECHMEKDSHVEAPGVEVPKASIRRSSRLRSKKKVSPCSQDACRSYHSSSNYTKKSLKTCLDRESSISESKIEEDNKHKIPHRNENNCLLSADTASMRSSAAGPSFKYHVRAKDGIRLLVDLNLKRSNWLKSMEKAVCVCQNHQKPGFGSFRQEVECLRDKNNLKINSPAKASASDASMNSYAQNKFSIKSMSREIGKTLPSVVEKEVTTISSLEFSTRDGYTKSSNSVVPDAPHEPASLLNMTVIGSKVRSKKGKSSELVHVNCQDTTMKENYSPNAECLEVVAFSSEENQFSDFSSHQKGSSCSRTGMICSENLLTSTFEVNQETAGNHRRSTVENRESINSAEGMEVSGRDGNTIVISASDGGRKRRKHNDKSDYIHGQSHQRILRSTKLLGGQILEQGGLVIRRSSRLLSKAVPFAGKIH
ncbi:uncharacterized protein LOC112529507 isoform X1 [Cynara cardunculus var. scolymus]|nr:uncharacterized protein LOC112529507 isoform X1 [Cynara cardunculus var. scolymus]XP_024996589.1 uncharacterized protein LOC112529507 isoform X1 [Cynara cardunculus var. scolymus]XP_024996590.1 uncharacterized protein LOC112529507 isoform X1 [Cynara cardunculus var. scolymus]XP_024996591.1 uncharacterized protein LOC112529507 isoform X1 [Cynara cardunculus var. scolymus]